VGKFSLLMFSRCRYKEKRLLLRDNCIHLAEISNPIRWGISWFAFFIEKAQERCLKSSKSGEQNASPGDHNEIIYQALVIRAE
jgi:hypothetical protein